MYRLIGRLNYNAFDEAKYSLVAILQLQWRCALKMLLRVAKSKKTL